MNRTVLIFPDTFSIVEFLIDNSVTNAEVESSDNTLTASLTDDDILTACADYSAIKLDKPFYPNDELDKWRLRRKE